MKKVFFYVTLVLALLAVVAFVAYSVSSFTEYKALKENPDVSGADRLAKLPTYATFGAIMSLFGLVCASTSYFLTDKALLRAIIGIMIAVLLLGAILSVTMLVI